MNEVDGMISQQSDRSIHRNRLLDSVHKGEPAGRPPWSTNTPFWVLGIITMAMSLDWPNEFGTSEQHVPGDSIPWFHAVTADL